MDNKTAMMAFPRNPERDAEGNAVLYPGMVRYEGIAAIFGEPGKREYIVLAPSVEALEKIVTDEGMPPSLARERCAVVTLERLQQNREPSGA